jgi:hypothetical protein
MLYGYHLYLEQQTPIGYWLKSKKGGRSGMTLARLEVALDMSTAKIEKALGQLENDGDIVVMKPGALYEYARYFMPGMEPKPRKMPPATLTLPVDARSQSNFNGRPSHKKGEEYRKLKAALQSRIESGLPFTPEDVARDAGYYAPTLYVRKELHTEVKQASKESMG